MKQPKSTNKKYMVELKNPYYGKQKMYIESIEQDGQCYCLTNSRKKSKLFNTHEQAIRAAEVMNYWTWNANVVEVVVENQ